MKKFLTSLVIFAFIVQFSWAQESTISSDAFAKLMQTYLKSETGQEAIGKATQGYIAKQQKKIQEERAKKEKVAFEEQFKNPIKVDVTGSPFKGPKDAKVTLVEFSDFQCPYCKKGANTAEQVVKAYPKDVKFVFKNLPLPFHKEARPAAKAALAANKQGKFWEMHDALFADQGKLGEELYLEAAKNIGLDLEKFKKDLEDPEIEAQISADEKLARQVGISGTPGFVVNGVLVKGAFPFSHFKKIIDRWLSADPTKPLAEQAKG